MSVVTRIRREMAARLARKVVHVELSRSVVTFAFDDFPRSAFYVGGEVLAKYGLCGTYYCSMALSGEPQSPVGPLFRLDDLQQVVSAGHEIGCHTFDHSSCLSSTAKSFRASCERNQHSILKVLPGYRLRSFAFPHGHTTLAAKWQVRSLYDTCRTTVRGINAGEIDLAHLCADPLYSCEDLERIKSDILQNAAVKGWLIVFTHDVSPNPSSYGCTPKCLQEVVSAAMDSGADILTAGEAIRRIRESDAIPKTDKST